MLKRLNMMELRGAPGEMLERMRWNNEDFALLKQGKLAAFVVSRDFMVRLQALLPYKVPCDFCCVNIISDGFAVHELECPARFVKEFFMVEPPKQNGNSASAT